jgi:signal transduction histidine kinase
MRAMAVRAVHRSTRPPADHRRAPTGLRVRAGARMRGCVLGGCVIASLLGPPTSAAQDRVVRTFGPDDGFSGAPVAALVQDDTGFLWIGAQGGLFRFDGEEIRRWAPDVVPGPVTSLTTAPDGRVAALGGDGRAYVVTAEAAQPLPSAGAPTPHTAYALTFDHDGILWAIVDGTLAHLDPDGAWRPLPSQALDSQEVRRIAARPGGGVLAATLGAVWALENGRSPVRIPLELPASEGIQEVIAWSPEEVHVLLMNGEVRSVGPGGVRTLVPAEALPGGRAISLVEREGTFWLALDRHLVAVRPDGPPEVLGQVEGIESGGPLLVDREGSLWLGSFVGLHQLPEPDTRLWSEREGLPSRHARAAARTGDALWIMTWSGPGAFRFRDGTWHPVPVDWDSRGTTCTDSLGGVWTSFDEHVVMLRDTTVTPYAWPASSPLNVFGCTPSHEGGVWIGTRDELGHLDPETGEVRLVPLPPGSPTGDGIVAALHDRRDRLWVVTRDRICSAPAPAVRTASAGQGSPEIPWSCDEIPGLDRVVQLVEWPSGALWASSQRLGVLAGGEEGWRPLPMDGLPTRSVLGLVPSPRGGVWVVGHGVLQRVEERGADGWEVLERLGSWQGLPAATGGHLVEESDGTLWVATSRGVFEIPAHVRRREPGIPPVSLVDARVDDEAVPLGGLELPFARNRIELRFAALTFRDRSRLRHQVRLGPGGTWTEWRGEPAFRWVDLRPGSYTVEYRASLDGETWSTLAEPFSFRVLTPWWVSWWFIAAVGLLVGTAVWMGYRARVAYLVGLERQRTRIAMDLHDEVGSGLASVGILSGVLAVDSLDREERRSAALEIARAAEELGHSLSDIVWSLDPGTGSMKELAGRLAEHGARLFADDGVAFSTRFPRAWPRAAPSLEARRTVLLVGLEALHNAARHSGAETVTLGLHPDGPGRWALRVRDDGVGVGDQAGGGGGRGLPGMEARARQIGGTLAVGRAPEGGTEVVLRFPVASVSTPRRGWAAVRRRVARWSRTGR